VGLHAAKRIGKDVERKGVGEVKHHGREIVRRIEKKKALKGLSEKDNRDGVRRETEH